MNDVAHNLAAVKQRISEATERSGCASDSVTLVAVSKTWPVDHVQLAVVVLGHAVFGTHHRGRIHGQLWPVRDHTQCRVFIKRVGCHHREATEPVPGGCRAPSW